MLRIPLVISLALLPSCDPVNEISVRFSTEPDATAHVYWVTKHGDRAHASRRVFHGPVPTGQVEIAQPECCGTARAYRDRALWFLACVERGEAPVTLICGRPGDPDAKLVRNRHPTTTACDALERSVGFANLDLETCAPRPLTDPR